MPGGIVEELEMDDDFYTKNDKGEYVMKIHTSSDMMEEETEGNSKTEPVGSISTSL